MQFPLEHKYQIQSKFLRYRDLSKDEVAASEKAKYSTMALWLGAIVIAGEIGRAILHNPGFPKAVLGAAVVGVVVGWIVRTDAREKMARIRLQLSEIYAFCDQVGVVFPHSGTRAWSKGKLDTTLDLFHDESYR
jgi:hypothetical protein